MNASIIACCGLGHTSGSLCCVFTKLKLCCSGLNMPIKNNDKSQDQDSDVMLDNKGHVTTNKGGVKIQIDSVNEMTLNSLISSVVHHAKVNPQGLLNNNFYFA